MGYMPILRTNFAESPAEQREKEKFLEEIGSSLKFLVIGKPFSRFNQSINGITTMMNAISQIPSLKKPTSLLNPFNRESELDLEDYDLKRSFIDALEHTPDGGFVYEGKRIRGLSTDQLEGKLLKALLEAEDNFLTDQEICKTLSYKTNRDCSFILRNLKNALQKNDLELIIERRKWLKGYVLVDIEAPQKVSQK